MNLQQIESSISTIDAQASFIFRIYDSQEHAKAIELMETLLEDYEQHEILIGLLCASIEKYENEAIEFSAFNKALSDRDSGSAVLATLMDQNNLGVADFQHEIGGKSLVSMILNGKRQLNLGHIRRLAKRFNVPEQIFI